MIAVPAPEPDPCTLLDRLLAVISLHDLERLVRHIESANETGYGRAWISFGNHHVEYIAHEATDKSDLG